MPCILWVTTNRVTGSCCIEYYWEHGLDQSSVANVLGSVSDLLHVVKKVCSVAALALLFGVITQVHWRYGLGIYSWMFSSFLEIPGVWLETF